MTAQKFTKPILFMACLGPLLWLVYGALSGGLGANPVEAIIHATGDWTLRLLLATLMITPLRRISGWTTLIRYRRMLGLFAFAYLCLHLSAYLVLDQFFDWRAIGADILKRPYISVGFAGFLMLVPLAVTSGNTMIRRLGGRSWQRIHRLIYPATLAGVLHYLWLVKADLREPLLYGGVWLALMLLRVPPLKALKLPRRQKGHIGSGAVPTPRG